MRPDQETPEERLHRVTEAAAGQYTLFGRLDEEGRRIFVDGVISLVQAAQERLSGQFNNLDTFEILGKLDEPDEQGLRMVSSLKRRFYEMPSVSTKTTNRMVVTDAGLTKTFADVLMMERYGLGGLEDLRKLRNNRKNFTAVPGRERHSDGPFATTSLRHSNPNNSYRPSRRR